MKFVNFHSKAPAAPDAQPLFESGFDAVYPSMEKDMPAPLRSPFSLAGKRGLILGVANQHSIAHGCAQVLHGMGAALMLSCANDKALPFAAPLAAALKVPLLACDVEQDGALEHLVSEAVASLGGLDFVIHSIAWAPLQDLHGRVIDSSSAGFLRAMNIPAIHSRAWRSCANPICRTVAA